MRLRFIALLFILSTVTGRTITNEDSAVQPSEATKHGFSVKHTSISNHPSTNKLRKPSNSNRALDGKIKKHENANLPNISPNLKPSTRKLVNSKTTKGEKQQYQLKPVRTTISPNLKPVTGKRNKPKTTKGAKQQKLLKSVQTTSSPNLKPVTERTNKLKTTKGAMQLKPVQTTISPNLKRATGKTNKPQTTKGAKQQLKPVQTTISPNLKPSNGKSGKPKTTKDDKLQKQPKPVLRSRMRQTKIKQTQIEATPPTLKLTTRKPKLSKYGLTRNRKKLAETIVPPNLVNPSSELTDSPNSPAKKETWYKRCFDGITSYICKFTSKNPESTNSTECEPIQTVSNQTGIKIKIKLALPLFCSVEISKDWSVTREKYLDEEDRERKTRTHYHVKK